MEDGGAAPNEPSAKTPSGLAKGRAKNRGASRHPRGSVPSESSPPAGVGPLLPPSFYERPAVDVARALVGCILVRGEVTLRITEVEAYGGPADSASHARFGRTARNAPVWGPPGRAYVYLCYGLHQMLNIVAHPPGPGEAGVVLIRACEPLRGLALIRDRRGGRDGPTLLDGPGKVGAALALDGRFNHHPVHRSGGLELRRGAPPPGLSVGARVGIDYAAPADRGALWRFAWPGSVWTSHRRHLHPVL